jgi:hypothetical protein
MNNKIKKKKAKRITDYYTGKLGNRMFMRVESSPELARDSG